MLSWTADWIEAIAAGLLIINIVLIARRSLWNYPVGLAAAGLYFLIFVDTRLYSAALLQVVLFVVQLFGWWNWRRFLAAQDLPVTRMSMLARCAWLLALALLAGGWGTVMSATTDARVPYFDALLSIASLGAQSLFALRLVEGWIVTAGVNLGAIVLFTREQLYTTAALFALLLLLSVAGLRSWWRASG